MSQNMPQDKDEFTTECIEIVKKLKPELTTRFDDTLSIVIEGKRLNLTNVYKMARSTTNQREVVRTYLEHILEADEIFTYEIETNFLEVRSQIYPRIQHKSIFESLSPDLVAYSDWVNECVICYVLDYPSMTVSVNVEQLIKWKVDVDDLHEISLRNLRKTMDKLEITHFKVKDGSQAAMISTEDGYDASRILAPELYQVLSGQFEGDFYAGLPSRDMLLAVPVNGTSDGLLRKVRTSIMKDYHRLPYPITPDLFYVTLDGVAGATDFQLPSDTSDE